MEQFICNIHMKQFVIFLQSSDNWTYIVSVAYVLQIGQRRQQKWKQKQAQFIDNALAIHKVKWRHRVYGHDTIAILLV